MLSFFIEKDALRLFIYKKVNKSLNKNSKDSINHHKLERFLIWHFLTTFIHGFRDHSCVKWLHQITRSWNFCLPTDYKKEYNCAGFQSCTDIISLSFSQSHFPPCAYEHKCSVQLQHPYKIHLLFNKNFSVE